MSFALHEEVRVRGDKKVVKSEYKSILLELILFNSTFKIFNLSFMKSKLS